MGAADRPAAPEMKETMSEASRILSVISSLLRM